MKKEIIIAISFLLIGFILGVIAFYNEDWYRYRPHLEWNLALRNYDKEGNLTRDIKQCLYYFSPMENRSAKLIPIFCIKIGELE